MEALVYFAAQCERWDFDHSDRKLISLSMQSVSLAASVAQTKALFCEVVWNEGMPVWRNGRRTGLKILGGLNLVSVRVRPPAPNLTVGAATIWDDG